ncbi:MAG: protein kinase domain-containing protein [Deltaproteobacteria bacterium]
MEPTPSSSVLGQRLGRYTLLGKLATGGMAEVFLARQDGPKGFAKTVVIKRILPHFGQDEQFVQMFLNEARLAALINHPNVVSIYELGEDPEALTYFMAMEYIDGCNLKRLAQAASQRGRPLRPAVAARIVADACAGLDFAHSLKGEGGQPLHIVHRDVSPENVLVTYSGLVKVVDFGIAKASHSEGKTRTGQVKGKLSYMSPEQILAQPVDRRADVWALGVTLYWLCAGGRPFRGDNEGQVIHQVLSVEPPPIAERFPGFPEDLERIIQGALTKDVARRYPTAAAMQNDLERWLALSGQAVTPTVLATYMNDLFPEASDPDRLLTRAILSGDLRQDFANQHTPSRTRPAAKTETGRRFVEVAKRRKRLVLGGGAALLLTLVAGGALLARSKPEPTAPPEPSAAAAPPPSAAPAPLALPPPPAAVGPGPTAPAKAAPRPPAREATRHPSKRSRAAGARANGRSRPAPPSDLALPAAAAPAPEPVAPPVPVAPPGKLDIHVLPWASVFIDGQLVGTTPLAPIELPAGKHRVDLVNDGLGAKRTLSVLVQSGETAQIKQKL